MNKRTRFISSIICIIFTLGIAGTFVLCDSEFSYAGGLNGPEAGLMSRACGNFTYKGKTYVATESSVSRLRSYLCSDGVDLTQEQADRAASYMYGNVRTGIIEGYIVPAGGASDEPEEEKDEAESKILHEKSGTASVTVDFEKSSFTVKSKDNEEIMKGETLVKNTGMEISNPLDLIKAAEVFLNEVVEDGAPVSTFNKDDDEHRISSGSISRDDLPSIIKGGVYGNIRCDIADLDCPVYYGDDEKILAGGAGQNSRSGLPGEGRMILVGGHDVGCFDNIDKLGRGDSITIDTEYGTFEYRVTKIAVDDASYITMDDLNRKAEKLVLYTCYPLGNVLDSNPKRLYVMADKVSGPEITGGAN